MQRVSLLIYLGVHPNSSLQFLLASFYFPEPLCRPLCQIGFGPVRKIPSLVIFGLNRRLFGKAVKSVATNSYLMAATTHWPKHGSSQQVYPHAGFSTVPRLVLPLPYASTGSTVCMHGDRSSNGCCPSFITGPCGVLRWIEFELASFTILSERVRLLCAIAFGPVRKSSSWVIFGLDRSLFGLPV